ncbi:ArsR family transcriptional regulator [Psychrobacter namhaensis]|uniref:ArsR family transcriptional regulator n=1 Tax=Psychrobacter namhaensis TaxID=292734 RepID=A0ABW8L4I5_9GAMM
MPKCTVLTTTKAFIDCNKPLSVRQLHERTKLHKRTIQRHIKQMMDAGLVEASEHYYANEYTYQMVTPSSGANMRRV